MKCIVYNLHILIYYYIPFNESQPVWCGYANVADAISTIVNDVGTISVDAIGLDTNIVGVIITDAIGTDEKLYWIGDNYFNKIAC